MAKRPFHDRLAEAKSRLPAKVQYERIVLPSWSAADITADKVRLLRGRVLVRPIQEVTSSVLFLPTPERATTKTVAHGIVVAMGPPMFKKGGIRCDMCGGEGGSHCDEHEDCNSPCFDCTQCGGTGRVQFEIPHNFKVGDHVLHVGQHMSRDVELRDEVLRSVAQEEIQGVVEGEVGSIDTRSDHADYRTVIR